MKRVYMNITAYVMAVIIILTSILSLPLSVSAQTTATDDNGNNIIKVLDMALNKSGISASPTTIQDFLDYMHDTVTAGAQAWSDLADTTYNTVSDYVSACKEKIADTASNIPAPAKSLINGYLDYMGKCFDTRANFDAGYSQGKNFRNYLMSYVTDVNDKQLNGSIGSNSNYNIKGALVNLVRQNMDEYIKEYEGYFLVPTTKVSDILPTWFSKKTEYDDFCDIVRHHLDIGFYGFFYNGNFDVLDFNDTFFVSSSSILASAKQINLFVYNSNWENEYSFKQDNNLFYYDSSDNIQVLYHTGRSSNNVYLLPEHESIGYSSYGSFYFRIYSRDGSSFKVWKSVDQYKLYSVGKSNIYYSNTYSSFDNSVDNSVTFSGGYYMTNDYSHTTIQNNIDNSQEINETTVNNIVNNYITNNYYGSDGSSGGNGSGGGSGNWFTDLITGIPQLLSALLDGITGLFEAGGKLLEVVTELFTKLFIPSEGFADPLIDKVNEKFTFKEQSKENIDLIFNQFSDMGQTIPTITFPFSKTSLAKYGVEDYTVSFDWYAPYKPAVDLVFSAILWVMFAFNQYFAVKNIVNASGSAVDIATRL